MFDLKLHQHAFSRYLTIKLMSGYYNGHCNINVVNLNSYDKDFGESMHDNEKITRSASNRK
jgi:hypothetical protein